MERGYETCETGLIFLNQAYLRDKKGTAFRSAFLVCR